MSATIGKLAPTAAVAAIVAWCCWSYFGETESPAGAQQADSLPEIATRLLSPIVEPASDRNPFKAWEDLNADSARIEQLVAEIAGETAAPSKEEVLKILGNLELGATFIQGRRRMAVIGGRVYEQGEPLVIPGPITEPCIVAQVSARSVLIQYMDETVQVKYRNAIASANLSKP